MTRRYARAPGGERARGSVPRNHGTGTTLVAALTTSGIEAPMALEGALDTAAWVAYVREVLYPILKPGQIVLIDNLNVHKAEEVRHLIEEPVAGCGSCRPTRPTSRRSSPPSRRSRRRCGRLERGARRP